MNQRDFHYVEDRLYGNVALGDAIERLEGVGEQELADALRAESMRHADALRDLRAQLRERAR